ncbi:MAG: T9SS type A sorting domain-containing protein, partial [Bacteroidia bacterium]|nr:T9SS type A sorting domain-containing protein [Bacteroidia bacterium]
DVVDYWSVNVVEDGELSWTITSGNGQDVYALLLDGDGTTVLEGNYTTSTATYSKDGLAPGTYYIKIYTYYSYEFAPYELSCSLLTPVQANDTGSNDTTASPSILPLNGSSTGHIGYRYNGNVDVVDYWSVNVVADGELSWTITSENGQTVYAMLLDGDGTTVLAGNYTGSTATFSKNGLAPGIYYIKIYTYYSNEFAPYTISNVMTPAPLLVDIEPNNTISSALPFPVNSSTTGHIGYSYNNTRDDTDMYAITLPEDGKLGITITSNNGQNVYALFYDHNGSTLLSGNYTTTTYSYSLNNLAAGTYYIKVRTYYANEFSQYTLSNSLEPMNWSAEVPADNGIAASGTLLPANTLRTGHLNFYYDLNYDNPDWWQIGYDGAGAMDLSINLEQNHFNGDYPYIGYALYLDTNASAVASGQVHNPTNTITLGSLAVGRYWLKLTQGYSTFGAYQLQAAYTERCSTDVSISVASMQPGCLGSITYSLSNGLPPYLVQLYQNGNPYGTADTTSSDITFSNLPLGSYYAKAYSFGASGTCDNVSPSHDFTAPVAPTVSLSESPVFCDGGSITLTSSTASSYLWSTSETTQDITVTTGGNYSVVITDSYGCTASSSPVAVTVHANPATPLISPDASTTFCDGGSVNLSTQAGYSYLWSNSETTQSIHVTTNGAYTVTITDGNGCTATSLPETITVNSAPATTISGNNVTCFGGSSTLTSSAGDSYSWSTGETSQSVTVSPVITTAYTVTVTYPNGCTSSATQTVTPTSEVVAGCSLLADASCNGSQDGSVMVSATGGTPPYTGTGQISSLAAGTYTFTVTDFNGCTGSCSITVSEPPVLTASATATDASCSVCADGSISIASISGGTTPYSVSPLTPMTGLIPGNYCFTVTDANGCTAQACAVVGYSGCSLSATCTVGNDVSCFGGNDGSASVSVSGGSGNYSYAWTGGGTAATASGLSAGTYTVTVTDQISGCTSTCSATITEPSQLNATCSLVNSVSCNGGTDGEVAISASGGTPPYTGTGNITGLSAGTYSYTVTDDNGCTATCSVTVTEPPALTISAIPSGNILCFGGSTGVVVTAAGGTPPYTGTGTFTQNAGTIVYSVVDDNGCAVSASITLSEPAKLEGTTSAVDASCGVNDGSASVTPAGGTAPYGYLWNPGGQTTATATGLAAGSYTVTITDANGCSATKSVTVGSSGGSVNPAGPISGPSGICRNQSMVYSIAPVAGATSYTWTLPADATGSSTSESITISFGPAYAGGFICVTPQNSCGSGTPACINAPVFTVRPMTPTPIIGPDIVCGGTVATYSVTPVPNATSYTWSVAGTSVSILTGQGTNSIDVNIPPGFGQSSVSVYASNCIGNSAASGMYITGNPVHSSTLFGPGNVCANTSGVNYYISAVRGAASYVWTTTGDMTVASSSGPSVVVDFGPTFTNGTLTVTTFNSCGSFSKTYIIKGTPNKPGGITGPFTSVCGATGVTYSIAPVSGATGYTWTLPPNVTALTPLTGTSITVDFQPAFVNGTICVSAINGCGTGPARCGLIQAVPGSGGTISGLTSVCKSQSGVNYSISPVPGALSYIWAVTGGGTITPSGTSASVNFNSATATMAIVIVNGVNTCGYGPPGKKVVFVNLGCRTEGNDQTEESFSAYPNPAHDKLSVRFNTAIEEKYLIRLSDITGKTVIEKSLPAAEGLNQSWLDISHLPAGVYILSSESSSTERQVLRVVIE